MLYYFYLNYLNFMEIVCQQPQQPKMKFTQNFFYKICGSMINPRIFADTQYFFLINKI